MASSLSLTNLLDKYPSGTTVGAYKQSNWATYQLPPSGAPVGSSDATGSVSAAGAVTLTGLADDTDYFITDSSGTKYVSSSTRVSHSGFEEALGGDFTGALPNPTIGTGKVDSSKIADGTIVNADVNASAGIVGSKLDPATAMRAELATTQYTVYLDQSNGSDSNTGRSPGAAFQTIGKAISTLNQSSHGGQIRVVTRDGGAVNASAPLHCVQPITIRALGTYALEIDRNFTPNGRSFWDAVTTAAGSSVQSATAAFVAGDVNSIISVYGAGTNGGTFYDFISAVPDGTHATLTGTTPVARDSGTDPIGVKGQVVGDWNRVVTDAAMSANGSVVTSATAAFTSADIGTEIFIAGAGHGNQALRATILSVTSTTATILGKATNTVSGKRCAIGVNFGDLLTFHVPNCGLDGVTLLDPSVGSNRIGAALKLTVDDGYGQSTGQHWLNNLIVTNSDPASAWEHDIDIDGAWNQAAGGGGVRKVWFTGGTFFGARRPTETIRINTAVHLFFTGGGCGGTAPTASVAQGILVLDPGRTRAGGSTTVQDVHFGNFEGIDMYFYSEGQYVTFTGGRLGWSGTAVTGRNSIYLASVASDNFVCCENKDTSENSQKDKGSGNNNRILTGITDRGLDLGSQTLPYTIVAPNGSRGGVRKVTCTSTGTLSIQQPDGTCPLGTMIGFDIVNSTGGAITMSWSGNYKQSYTPPANGKRNQVWFRSIESGNWIQAAPQGPDL